MFKRILRIAIDFAARKIKNPIERAIAIAALVLAFASLWAKIVRSD